MFKVNIKDTRRRDFTKISPYLPTFCPDNTKKISILPSLMVAWGDEGEGGGSISISISLSINITYIQLLYPLQ